ncbi:zinc finger protein 391-like [Phlebotomus argentipes]|uniref:zinc finger protein 391-like n=1 Tax=Phlebotomus argentipes TaxID=94469 RepID=UPI0028934314|nr:zinc finger protein 391-like [Phlebotomus argentipes]
MCAQSTKECEYCHREVNSSSNRLIQELCGHNKCRRCFIQEKDGCQICDEESRKSTQVSRVTSAPCKMKTAWAQMMTANGEPEEGIVQEENGEKSMDSEALQIDTDLEETETPPDEDTQEENAESPPVVASVFREPKKRSKFVIPKHVKRIEEQRFECTICQRQFSSRQQCVYHSYCDTSIKKPHECSQCGLAFVTLNHLQYHMESHEENNLRCSLCSKQFNRSQSLQKHLKVHKAEHEHKCSRCNMSFPFRFQLKQHEFRHENIRPYKCTICPRAFTLKENLKKHFLVHSKEKRFSCEDCGKKFSRNTTLKVHRNTHSKKRLFGPCSSCGKTFVDSRSFARHLLSHNTTLNYSCSLCNATFKRKDNLRRHVRIIHPEESLQETLQKSTKAVQEDEEQIAAVNFPPGRTCSVIRFTGNIPPSIPEPAAETEDVPDECAINEEPERIPEVTEKPPKPKKPFDPLEIYRKILCPSRDDEDEDPAPDLNLKKTSQESSLVHWRKRTSLNFTQNARRKD